MISRLNSTSVCVLLGGIIILQFYNLYSDIPQSSVVPPKSINPSQPRPISNYWQHILELHQEGDTFRIVNPSQRISPRKFPFELFRELTPNEFLRACRDAIKSATEEGKRNNWTEEEILGKSFENLTLVLEYYGLYVEKPSEIDMLINAIGAEKEEPILRLFLIKQLNSQPPSQSLFAIHFQDLVKSQKDGLTNILLIIVKRTNERPDILLEATTYFYNFLYDEYTEILKSDAVVQAYAYTKKVNITPSILKANDLPKPLDKTQAEMEKLNKTTRQFLTELQRISTSKNTAIEIQSKKLIEMILNNFPIHNG